MLPVINPEGCWLNMFDVPVFVWKVLLEEVWKGLGVDNGWVKKFLVSVGVLFELKKLIFFDSPAKKAGISSFLPPGPITVNIFVFSFFSSFSGTFPSSCCWIEAADSLFSKNKGWLF